jgi:predicted NBD/HSP70 family sugar kinase
MRTLNRSIVLNTIKTLGPIDRARIARHINLSPATVTTITADLISEGLVFEKEPGDSRGGRRPILLAINPKGAYVVGIKLTETRAIAALTDLEATILAKRSSDLSTPDPETAIDLMAQLTNSLLEDAGIPSEKLIGVGVGLAGIVDFQKGILRQGTYLGWRNLPVRNLLREKINAEVYVDNDVNTLTLAEVWFGCGQGIENFLTVTVGRGVGLGIVTNHQYYRGAGGGAGEFGHIVIDPDGVQCDCGKRGCLETLVGDPGLLRQAGAAFERGELDSMPKNTTELAQMASQGSQAAIEILKNSGEVLGQALANLINIFNPHRILVSGEGVSRGPFFFDALKNSTSKFALPDLYSDVDLRIEPWGDDVWARGAASLVLRSLFESPVHEIQNQ